MGSTVFATVSTPGPPGPAGPAGRTAVWYVNPGVPSNSTGLNGDMYLNNVTGDVYGPKAGGAWGPIVANIKGPAGAAGYAPQYIVAAGVPLTGTGNNGDMYINSSTSDVYGPKSGGVWGPIVCNIKGASGATGPQGPPGIAYTPRGAWSAATTYAQGDEVTYSSQLYIGLQASNLNNVPSSSPTWWQMVGSGAAQTPWASDIDAATHNLTNAGAIVGNSHRGVGTFTGSAMGIDRIEIGVVSGSPRIVLEDATFTLWSVDNSAGVFRWFIPGFDQMKLSAPSNNALVQVINASAVAAIQLNSSGNSYFNGGNVGINNGSPGYKLDVTGDVNITGTYRVNGVPLSTGGGTPAGSSGQVQFNNASAFGASANLFWDITNSRLGIGTGGPQAPLHVYKAQNAVTAVTIDNDSTGTTGLGQAVRFAYGATGVLGGIYHVLTASGTWALRFKAWGGSGEVERMMVDGASGNVGIGTTSPAALLHLEHSPGGANAVGSSILLGRNGSSVLGGGIWNTWGGPSNLDMLVFGVGNSLSPLSNPVMTILATSSGGAGGNVGILNISPAYALDVTGDIRCSGVHRGTLAGGTGSSAVIGVADNVASNTVPAGTIAFSFNTSGNVLIIYCKYSGGTTKSAAITLT